MDQERNNIWCLRGSKIIYLLNIRSSVALFYGNVETLEHDPGHFECQLDMCRDTHTVYYIHIKSI